MKNIIYKLTFTTPLHLSDVRADYGKSERCIHSDTLYAAIMQAWSLSGNSEWIAKEPSFAVSSLFPYATDINNDVIYFFPKPYVLPIKEENRNPDLSKKFKKIQYLDKEYFEKLLQGEYNPSPESLRGEFLTKKNFIGDKEDVNEKEEENKPLEIIISQVIPRIRWNRNEKKDSEPFYMEKLFFKEGAGLWFLFLYDDEEIKNRFEAALNLLSHEGIGTDRNVGNGRFNYTTDKFDLELPPEADYCISLSLFSPDNQETLRKLLNFKQETSQLKFDKNVGYDFMLRGGWISEPFNTYRKKSVYMFTEGSVFKQYSNDISVMGKGHEVTPKIVNNKSANHKIYRTGKAVFLPIKLEENEIQ